MRRNEKILLAVLLAIFVAWQGERLLRRFVFSPIGEKRSQVENIDREIQANEIQQKRLDRAEQQLQSSFASSLPPDPLTAQRLYQQWLTDLAHRAGFSKTSVIPDRVTNQADHCSGVMVSIDAEATLGQLAWFLERFYETDLLHQVVSLNMDSLSDRGDPPLRVTIIAEGLALHGAPSRRVLFPQTTLDESVSASDGVVVISNAASFPSRGNFIVRIGDEYARVTTAEGNAWSIDRGILGSSPSDHSLGEVVERWPMRRIAARPRFDMEQFLAANPFAKPVPKVVEQPIVSNEEEEPQIDLAQFTYLVGTISQGGRDEAWFFNRFNKRRVVAVAGGTFSIANLDGELLAVDGDFVEILCDERRWRLKVGKNLNSMERIAEAEDTAPTDSSQ